MTSLTEAAIERMALDELKALGWERVCGLEIAPDGLAPERSSYGEVVLVGRLRAALERINPHLPPEAIDQAIGKVLRPENPSLIENNRTFHYMVTDGVDVAWMGPEGERYAKAWLVDLQNLEVNDWLAVNQFTVVENKMTRRPDVVLFLNGLPLVVMELKNPGTLQATLESAFRQLETYRRASGR
jgi:type I restriction enzyme R subunit